MMMAANLRPAANLCREAVVFQFELVIYTTAVYIRVFQFLMYTTAVE